MSKNDLEGVPRVSMDYGFFGGKESQERVTLVLVIRERRHKMTWKMLVQRKGTEFRWIAKRAAKFMAQLGFNRVTLRCDTEPTIEALASETVRQEGSQTVPETTSGREPVQRNLRTHGGTCGWPGHNIQSCSGAPHWRQSPA